MITCILNVLSSYSIYYFPGPCTSKNGNANIMKEIANTENTQILCKICTILNKINETLLNHSSNISLLHLESK